MIIRILFFLIPIISFGQSVSKEIDSLIEKKNYSQAELTLTKLLDTNTTNETVLKSLGDVYMLQKKWEEASKIFTRLLELNPNSAQYHYLLGKSLGMEALGGNKLWAIFSLYEVKAAFKKTIKLDSKHIDAHWALLIYYTELPGVLGGSIDEAIQYSDDLEVISPVDGYLAKGYIYEYEKEATLAIENYQKAIEIGGSYTCYNELASYYKNTNNYIKAFQTLEIAQENLSIDTLYFQLGELSALYKISLDKGEAYLNRYLSTLKKSDTINLQWTYLRLAQINKLNNNEDSASSYIEKTLAINPKFKPALQEKERLKN